MLDHWLNSSARRVAAVAVFAFLLYLPTLGFQLVWDDPHLVEFVRTQWQSGGARALLSSEFLLGSGSPHTGYFRPVVLASLRLDDWLGSGHAWVYHLTNLLLHACVCALVVLLLEWVLDDGPSAAFGGLLFAAHPVHVEAVAFVSGRTDLCAALLVFSATLLWVRARIRGATGSAGIPSVVLLVPLLLGALAKELAVMAIPTWFLWDLINVPDAGSKHASWSRRNAWWVASALVAVALLALMRSMALGAVVGGAPTALAAMGSSEVSAAALVVPRIVTYLRLLVVPWPLSSYYVASDLTPTLWGVIGALLALAMFAALERSDARRLGAAAAMWTFLFLFPVLGIASLSAAAVAERFLYIPSFGTCFAAAALWGRLFRMRRVAALTLAGMTIDLFTGATVARSRVWRDQIPLYTDMIKTSPRAFNGHFNLGIELAKVGRFDEAETSLRTATEVAPTRADAWNNLGSVRARLGKEADAAQAFGEAVRLMPDFRVARKNLAGSLARLGHHDEAAAEYSRALALAPDDIETRFAYFDELAAQRRWAEGLAALDAAPPQGASTPALLARRATALIEIGRAFAEAGRVDDAEDALRSAIRAAPDRAEAHGDLGLVYLHQGKIAEAIPLLDLAVRLAPGDPALRFNLGRAMLASGNRSEAMAQRDALRAMDPRLAEELTAWIDRSGGR